MPPLEIRVRSSMPEDGKMPPYVLGRGGYYTVADLKPHEDGTLTIYKARGTGNEDYIIERKNIPPATMKVDIKNRSGWSEEARLAPGESRIIWVETNTHLGKQRVEFKNIKSH